MSPKIHAEFWKDDDVWALTSEQKLAYLWLITNGHTNNAGFLVISFREFSQDTGFTPEMIDGLCKSLPRAIKKDGRCIFIINFMRHQWSVGQRNPSSKLYLSLCNAIAEMPETLINAALQEYPELYAGVKSLTSPLKSLHKGEVSYKPLVRDQNRTDQNREEKSLLEGEPEGAPSPPPEAQRNGTPTLEQALAYIAKHVPGYTPAEVTSAWHSLEAGRDEMGRWPWGRGIVGDWRSAVISRIETQRKFGTAKNGQANSTSKRMELESQQRAIRQAIAESPANEASAAFRLDFTAEEKSALSELRRRDREISEALAKGQYQ